MGENRHDLTVPESVSNEYLKKIAWEFARNKGNLVKLPKILGLSDERWTEFLGWLKDRSAPRQPDPRYPTLAGPNGLVDTTPTLGSHGVRDMGRLIDDYGIKPYDGLVWVTNHYRAIADMAMDRISNWHWEAATFPAHQIAQWLWSQEDFDILVEDYLKPMRQQIQGRLSEAYDEWLPTVVYGADYE